MKFRMLCQCLAAALTLLMASMSQATPVLYVGPNDVVIEQNFTIYPGDVGIVAGTMTGQSNITNYGTLIVAGTMTGQTNITNNGTLIFEETARYKGASTMTNNGTLQLIGRPVFTDQTMYTNNGIISGDQLYIAAFDGDNVKFNNATAGVLDIDEFRIEVASPNNSGFAFVNIIGEAQTLKKLTLIDNAAAGSNTADLEIDYIGINFKGQLTIEQLSSMTSGAGQIDWFVQPESRLNIARWETSTDTRLAAWANKDSLMTIQQLLIGGELAEPFSISGAETLQWGELRFISLDGQIVHQAVPEPATMLLLGVGLVGLAGLKRSIRRS